MKKFLAGLIAGIFFSIVLYFFINPSHLLNTHTGEMLDRDTLYLKDGSIMKGWIKGGDNISIIVETGKGFFTIPRAQCRLIQENTLLLYVRELI
jgi:hypothetical protein